MKCFECKLKFKIISHTHLKYKHNMTVGEYKEKYGENVCLCSNETRQKMIDIAKGKNTWTKGIHRNEKTKKNISRTLKGRVPWNKGLTKYDHPSLAKMAKKVSMSLKGNTNNKSIETKPQTYCYCGCSDLTMPDRIYIKGHQIKGLNYEQIYGKKRAKEIKQKIGNVSLRNKGKTYKPMSEKGRENIRRAMIGKKPSSKTIEKIKIARSKQIFPFRDSSIEIKVQGFLSDLYIPFIKHKYMNIKHFYSCDVFIPSLNLVIECDGNYWHNYPHGNEIDKIRTNEMKKIGFNVLRLWESEIKELKIEDFNAKLGGFL